MIAVLVALLAAAANGATAARLVEPPPVPGAIVVEFVAARCPTFDDEPCYVVVDGSTLRVEVGP